MSKSLSFYKLDMDSPVYLEEDDKISHPVTTSVQTISDFGAYTEHTLAKDILKIAVEWKINGKPMSYACLITYQSLYSEGADMIWARIVDSIVKKFHYPPQVGLWINQSYPVSSSIAVDEFYEYKFVKSSIPDIRRYARELPGINTVVAYPCEHRLRDGTIHNIIIHLNDEEKWTREKIADWLDLLAERDGIDLTFKVDADKTLTADADKTLTADADKTLTQGWENLGYTTE